MTLVNAISLIILIVALVISILSNKLDDAPIFTTGIAEKANMPVDVKTKKKKKSTK